MRKLNIVGNRAEDKIKVEKLFKHFYDKDHGDSKKIHDDIVRNVVNNTYVRNSNEFLDLMWEEFNRYFPS
jgi:hypothetical protein